MTDLDRACAHFRKLLEEQTERVAHMDAEKVDFAKKETITIGVIDGDGIGPVIMEQAVRVLSKLLSDKISSGRIRIEKIQGLTIENRLQVGQSVPSDVLTRIKACDVLLKGVFNYDNG